KVFVKSDKKFRRVDLLFKQILTIDGNGFECSKQKIMIDAYVNLFGSRSSSKSIHKVEIGKKECENMVSLDKLIQDKINEINDLKNQNIKLIDQAHLQKNLADQLKEDQHKFEQEIHNLRCLEKHNDDLDQQFFSLEKQCQEYKFLADQYFNQINEFEIRTSKLIDLSDSNIKITNDLLIKISNLEQKSHSDEFIISNQKIEIESFNRRISLLESKSQDVFENNLTDCSLRNGLIINSTKSTKCGVLGCNGLGNINPTLHRHNR
ncbi:hypothetical protein BpHYR1_007621, partial [Brachionus plicatilis]